MSLHNLQVAREQRQHEEEQQAGGSSTAPQQQQQQRKCPNEPIPELDHKVMSKADRRRAAKNVQPPTKEEREEAREKLQTLRRDQRRMKKLGWRGRVREQHKQMEKRQRLEETELGMRVQDDAANFGAEEDEESKVVARRAIGVSRPPPQKLQQQQQSQAEQQRSSRVAQGLKKHRPEEDEDIW